MADFGLDLEDLQGAINALDELEDDVSALTTFTVGTGVSYSVFLEFGTSEMDARPFFQPAINEVRTKGVEAFIRANTRTTVERLNDAEDVIKTLALALERRIKEIITQKSLIDTGTLRASVVAVRGADPSVLPTSEDIPGDGDTPAPQRAGRETVSEAIEI